MENDSYCDAEKLLMLAFRNPIIREKSQVNPMVFDGRLTSETNRRLGEYKNK